MVNGNVFRSELEEIDKAFSTPSFYTHDIKKIDRRETHISLVFLTGEWVYKIKKPVDFGFLNYTTLDLRKHYCHREVELNRRLSEGIYDSVVPICRDENGELLLGNCKDPIEYAVRMREIPERTNFRTFLDGGTVSSDHIKAIAKKLADFYEGSPLSNPSLSIYGGVEYVRFNTYENFKQLEPFANEIGGRDLLHWMKKSTYKFTVIFRELFRERLEGGFVKDGHGDLRVDHIYFHKGVQIIDCIEFNNRFRYGDVTVDLSFLFMDLIRLGYRDWAYRIVEEYAKASGDLQMWFLLDFYTAYRAIVRAKVACLETLSHPEDIERNRKSFQDARKFMNLGKIHTLSYSIPTVWIFMGLPASGKSRLGRRVASMGHMAYLSSDQIRRKLFPQATRSPFGQGVYTKEMREIVYWKLFEETVKIIKSGRSVVVDATFASEKWRRALTDSISNSMAHILFVETQADTNVLRERLIKREGSLDTRGSDARIEHLDRFLATYEPPYEIGKNRLIQVDTSKGDEFQSLLSILSEGMRKRILKIEVNSR
ncbi:MAG: AAA family ATPase [Syntrophobacterales bacterium]|nr:AAA family ATPase [Syntrophobacterales bacterium]